MQTLVDHYPDASIEQDIIGRVPLHYALSNGASFEIVTLLLGAARNVAGRDGYRILCSVADFNGWLPIHVACFMGASPEVLQLIVEAYPDGVDVKTKKASTPRGLLKGISMNAQKKDVLEMILDQKGNVNLNQNGHGSGGNHRSGRGRYKLSPAKTNMEKVVRMSDETCSMGVTLEIHEDETSSLSSMETSRTGLKPVSKSSKRRLTHMESHLEYRGDGKHDHDNHNHNRNNQENNLNSNGRSNSNPHMALNKSSSGRNQHHSHIHHRSLSNNHHRNRKKSASPQLPTHAVYELEEQEQAQHRQEQARVYNDSPIPNSKHSSNSRRNIITPQQQEQQQRSAVSSDSNLSFDDDDDDSAKSFQPITDTATFC